ncbi:HBR442Cp [Eremothecium sinecaudum]|uniref:Very-long-chain (3R)-3-hydroxyacyl-CoA dehydratase n=1 Tax=Eremothecium sinecaudum TaxID=45286 RepID=A0A109UXM5_9SACH|nr:HBR442Cp [Eremothecium sinecaudum]AMD19343.1 HBR442Cp [Eremothecium sinecaudum]
MARRSVKTAEKSPFSLLSIYNLVASFGWGYLLYNVLAVYPKLLQPLFFLSTKNLLIIIQTGSLIEVLNAALGLVRAPVFTTAAQVASRLLMVIGVFLLLPETPAANGIPFITVLFAWSFTEVIRYFFYFYKLSFESRPPNLLVILRYNMFWVLYPVGVASELVILYSALPYAEEIYGWGYKAFLIFAMLTYIPGFPILFVHVIGQRNKAMQELKAPKGTPKKTT